MQKYPSDVSLSINCIGAFLEMDERQDQDNFPVSRRRNGAHGQYPKLSLRLKKHCAYEKTCVWT